MFWAMLTARFAATKDFPSPGTALVTIMDRGGLPEAGNRILPLRTLKISVSRDSGLTTDTRFGSILSRLISVETGSDGTTAMYFGCFEADPATCSSPRAPFSLFSTAVDTVFSGCLSAKPK